MDRLLANIDCRGVHKLSGPEDYVHFFAYEGFGGFELINCVHRAPNVLAHGRHICCWRTCANTVSSGGSYLVRDFRRLDQRFARHTSSPGAIAAYSVLLDECHLRSELRRKAGAHQAPGTCSNHHQVVMAKICHAFSAAACSVPVSSRCTKSSAMIAIANVP